MMLQTPIPEQFIFTLPKGTVIGGFVKTEDGQPIAGARVEVSLTNRMDQSERVLFNRWLAEEDQGPMTDAQGHWTLDNVPEGDYVEVSIRLSHPDYISDCDWGIMQRIAKVSTASLRQQIGTIVMARGIKVAGTVTDPKGNPVAGAIVVFGDYPVATSANQQSQEVRTDGQGVYRLPPLPPMNVTVTVIAEGWSPDLTKITITRENPPVNFQLKPGNKLRLRFVNESGKAVPGVDVGIEGWRGGKSVYNDRDPWVLNTKIPVAADKNGVYEWNWAPPDEVRYTLWANGYQTVKAAPYTADGVEHEVKLSR